MKVQVCINKHEYIFDQHIPFNAWVGEDDKGFFFITAHKPSDDFSLMVYRYNGVYWEKRLEISRTTYIIHAWASRHNLWWTKCHWFKDEDRHRKSISQYSRRMNEVSDMMKHSRKHKKSGSGIRLDKENFYAPRTITDYECREKPMHDFPRYY